MTREQRDAIRARCNAATEGPWEYSGLMEVYAGKYEVIGRFDELADVRFIAHARQDVPALLDALGEVGTCTFSDADGGCVCSRCGFDVCEIGRVSSVYFERLCGFCPCCWARIIEQE